MIINLTRVTTSIALCSLSPIRPSKYNINAYKSSRNVCSEMRRSKTKTEKRKKKATYPSLHVWFCESVGE